MKVGDLVINKLAIIGIPVNSVGLIIDTRYPRPEILDHTEYRILWTNGRQRWIDIRLFEVISESQRSR
jgi:hypothetical protein